MKKILLLVLLAATVCVLMGALPVMAEVAVPTAPPTRIDLTPLFQAVITVLAALITYRLMPWIRARTSQIQRDRLSAIVQTLVYAAEQLYKTGEIRDRLDYVQEGLLTRGYEVDRDAIEAAVRQLKLTDGLFIPHDAIVMSDPAKPDEEENDHE